jgi:hypothetical protein
MLWVFPEKEIIVILVRKEFFGDYGLKNCLLNLTFYVAYVLGEGFLELRKQFLYFQFAGNLGTAPIDEIVISYFL